VYAATSVPQKIIYEGRLFDGSGNPIIAAHDFRFSFWSAEVYQAGDVDGAGAVNVGAANYAGWNELQSVSPNADGFFSFELGTVSSLPTIDFTKHLYLQVEIKTGGAAATSFELMDRDSSTVNLERAPIGSVPYALNSDAVDGADVGTTAGDLVPLGVGDSWPISTIPGGTNQDSFTLDSDNNAAGNINIQFGGLLGKVLSWNNGAGYFDFNDDVNIQGSLTLTGTVDGVDVSVLDSTITTHLNGGVSKHDASEIDVEAVDGHYYSAGDLEAVIDALDQQIFNLAGTTINHKYIIPSVFEGATYVGDGTSNIGRLYYGHDGSIDMNYYAWTSTKNSLNDYDIILQIPLSNGFTAWDGATPWTFNYKSNTGNSADNKADIFIYDSNRNPVTLTGTSTNLANTSWSTISLGYSGTPTFTAGDTFLIVIKVSSQSKNEMHIGEVEINFTE
jgi:hypothetical protein